MWTNWADEGVAFLFALLCSSSLPPLPPHIGDEICLPSGKRIHRMLVAGYWSKGMSFLSTETMFLSCRAKEGGAGPSCLLPSSGDGQCCEHVLQNPLHWDRQGTCCMTNKSWLNLGWCWGLSFFQAAVTMHRVPKTQPYYCCSCKRPALDELLSQLGMQMLALNILDD